MLPAAAAIRKQGANKGATTAFLISTPESGVDSIAITYALLDPIMTVVRPIAAFFTATLAGFMENIFFWDKNSQPLIIDKSCPVDGCCDGVECPDEIHKHHHSFPVKIMAGLRFAYKDVWGDIVVWFFIGVTIAALITVLVPEDLMVALLGGGFNSMIIMLIVGVPLYICATASTPVAAALILKGVSPGAVLVFLLVGPATNITSISVLFNILGKKSTALYLVVLSASAVMAGLAVDSIYQWLNISPQAILGSTTELVPDYIKTVSALLLLSASVKPLWKALVIRFQSKKSPQQFISPFPAPMARELKNHKDK